jgi:sugar/nucleoside kinase (ribokinase family)
VKEALGGSAVYFAVSASFFTSIKLVAVVGEDFPQEHVNFLKRKNIDIKGLEIVGGETFRWKGRYTGDMNTAHTLSTCLNVFEKFHPKLPENYRESKYIFLANIDPGLQLEVLKQVKNPKLVASDTMNLWISLVPGVLKKTLKHVDMLIINDAEIKQFSGEDNIVRASRKVLQFGPKAVVVKRGEFGSMMFTGNSIFSVPAYPLDRVVDPTGAGDTFAGGLMGYLSKTDNIKEGNIRKAIIYGTVMASFNVQDFSLDRMKKLTVKEINNRFNEISKLTSF